MSGEGVDPRMLHAWLSARSIARGLPAPTADYGGYRVETDTDAEIRRWVFPHMCAGLVELAHSIREPRHLLKLCGEADELRPILPSRWRIDTPRYFMQAHGGRIEHLIATGYRIETNRSGAVIEACIRSNAGELAARGYAAETQEAFIYDRIATEPKHRRKGLGKALMAALQGEKRSAALPELLVATEDGRALYATLGWRTISPYATAFIVDRPAGRR